MPFFEKLVRSTAPNTKARTGLGNEDVRNAPADLPTEELFSTVGDYGLRILSENADDIIE